jgi:ubiquinone biosynthesis protein
LLLTPGFTDNLIFELSTMLMEELDFVQEARFTDLFRRRMRKTRQMRFTTSPKVFFEYSSEDVMVTEFIEGILLSDVLAALETEDTLALSKLEEIGFNRVIFARRLQLVARFNNFENLFFHADLHPANIMVKPGNKMVLIDFGSCGSFDRKQLNSFRRFFDAQSVDDIGGMVQAALGIIEPLPPMDRDNFGQRLEYVFWEVQYAIKSKHAEWWERISSRFWIAFLNLSREFQIPMRLNTLRMIRASMLTDTLAARLDTGQDLFREFRFYEKGAGKRARKQVCKRLHRLAGPSKFIRIQEGVETGLKLMYHVQRLADSLSLINIGAFIGKIDYFCTLVLRHLTWAATTLMVFSAYYWVGGRAGWLAASQQSAFEVMSYVFHQNTLWWVVAGLPSALVLWRMSFRLKEPQPWRR